jgi:hypothetical protein
LVLRILANACLCPSENTGKDASSKHLLRNHAN